MLFLRPVTLPNQPTLIAIGGAIDLKNPGILKEFIARAGGPQGRIAIISTASQSSETGSLFSRFFQGLGLLLAPDVLDVIGREQAWNPEHIDRVRSATGIFITGGVQARITSILGGTPLVDEMQASYRRGVVVAGTSAGAAALSTVMLSFGKSGSTPRQRIAQFLPGLGFTDRVIIDQHFRQRDRLGRLLYAVASHPGILGVGVDENTAVVLADEMIHVMGQNAVTIVDGTSLQATNVAEVNGTQPVAMSGACLHILTQGCVFDLRTRRAIIPSYRDGKTPSGTAQPGRDPGHAGRE